MLFHGYTSLDYVVVGWYFGPTATGLYKLATELVLGPVKFVSSIVIEIAFPTFARVRLDREQLVDQFVWFTRLNLVVVLPFVAFLAIASEQVILAVWGPDSTSAVTATRILCIVGVFRALSFVVPPLLDGIGKPSLTLRYMSFAAVIVPAAFVGAAELLRYELDYLSVAVAWAVAYPIAFALLLKLGLESIGLGLGTYLARSAAVIASVAVAGGVTFGVYQLLPGGLPPLASCAIVAALILAITGGMLSLQPGLGPRAVLAAFRKRPGR
jgi:O-antigen/teichoic acid export membrane protein